MRQIQTFILRLLVDEDEPQTLRGVLRVVADDEERSFTDEESLLALLRRMGHASEESLKACAGKDCQASSVDKGSKS